MPVALLLMSKRESMLRSERPPFSNWMKGRPMSEKVFRRWCSPRTVLVVMRPFDDPAQVLHSIRHAEQSGAKVMLVRVCGEQPCAESGHQSPQPVPPWIAEVDAARKLSSGHTSMWAEIVSRAFILNNVSVPEVPSLLQSLKVDRVVVSEARTPEGKRQPALERIIPALVDVPVWVLGRGMVLNLGEHKPLRRILLPVTYGPDLKFVFRFAWQLAKAQMASLSILHVFAHAGKTGSTAARSPLTVKSWLPWLEVNHSPADCRIELAIRMGEPASEIVEFNARKPHDLIVFHSSAGFGTDRAVQPKLVDQVCSQVSCPIAILGGGIDPSQYLTEPRRDHPRKTVAVAPPDPTVAVA